MAEPMVSQAHAGRRPAYATGQYEFCLGQPGFRKLRIEGVREPRSPGGDRFDTWSTQIVDMNTSSGRHRQCSTSPAASASHRVIVYASTDPRHHGVRRVG
jgi:hypothetical protein